MAADPRDLSGSVPGPFDVPTIRQLVRLMSYHQLTEMELEDGERKIKLKRGPKRVEIKELAASLPALPVPGAVAPAVTAAAVPGATAVPPPPGKKLLDIISPTPGTFYRAESPTAKPFVEVGSQVKPDSIVCIIEAMKVFNQIPAEVSGTIVEICVQNQQSVEYGQVLFRVEPA